MPTRSQYNARKAAGLCVTCGTPAASNGAGKFSQCAHHRMRDRVYRNSHADNKNSIATIPCQNPNCGKEFPKKYASDSRKYCSIACANSMPKNWKTRPEKPKLKTWSERLAAGLCTMCGRDIPALTGEKYCQKHKEYMAEYNALKYQKDKQKIAAPVSVEIIKELSLADQVRELKQQQRLTIGQVHLLFPGVSRQLREAISAAYYGR